MEAAVYSITGVVVGYLIKYALDKRQQFITKNSEIKREAYAELVELMLDLFSQDKLGEVSTRVMLKRLNSFYAKYILYASPEVINAFGDFMQFLYQAGDALDAKVAMSSMTRVFKHMRTDIGLSNFNLGNDAEKLLRAKFNDFDNLFTTK